MADFNIMLRRVLQGRCPQCGAKYGLCEHVTKQGKLKGRKRRLPTQAQKYLVNPLWRSGRRRNQGERP